jgi:hypothetical protein
MNPKKAAKRKRTPTGVSIERDLLTKAKRHATKSGASSFSAWLCSLISAELEQTGQSVAKRGEAAKTNAVGKLRRSAD